MSASAADAAPPPGTSTDELCRLVRKRISWELNCSNDDRPAVYHLLLERQNRVAMGLDMLNRPHITPAALQALRDKFESDLRGILATDTATLRRMVMNSATSVACQSHIGEVQRERDAALAARNAQAMPRVQPAEIVQRFAARGMLVRAEDGNLHVTPAHALTAADRDMLRANKAAILDALAQPAVV